MHQFAKMKEREKSGDANTGEEHRIDSNSWNTTFTLTIHQEMDWRRLRCSEKLSMY